MNIFTLVGKIVLDSGAAEKDLTQLKKQAEGAGEGLDDLKKDADETGGKLDKVAKDAKEAGDAIDTAGDKASKSGGKFDDLGKKTSGLASGLGSVAKIAGGFIVAQGLVGLGGFLADAAQGAAEDAAATDRLNQSLGNYVERSGIAEKGTENFSYALEELQTDVNERIEAGARLAFTDDDVRDSLQSLLNATDDYGEATKRQAAAMDLARGANIPLATATRLLGKINEENVDVFKKMGIELAENATEADALAAVQARYGGQAEAYAKSTAGQFEQAKIRMAELKEGIGAALLPAVTALMGFLVDVGIPTLETLANGVLPIVGEVFGVISDAVKEVHMGFTSFFDDPAVALAEGTPLSRAGAKIAQMWTETVQPALKEAIRIFGEVATFIGQHSKEIEAVVAFMVDFVIAKIEGMIQIIEGIVKVVTGVVALIDALAHGEWAAAWEAFKQILDGILDLILGAIKYTFGNIPEVILGLVGEAVSAGTKFATDLANSIINEIEKLPGKLLQAGKDAVQGFVNGLTSIDVGSVAAGIANKATLGLSGKLGIKSPSTVFHALGEFTMQGFANGMADSFNWAVEPTIDQMNAEIRRLFEEGLIGAMAPQTFEAVFAQVREDIAAGVFDPGAWGDLTSYADRAFRAIMSGATSPSKSTSSPQAASSRANPAASSSNSSYWLDPSLGVVPGTEAYYNMRKANVSAYFEDGTDWVPHDGIYGLHKGERVLTAEENAAFSSNGGAGVDMKLYNPTIYATDMNNAKRSFDTLGVGWAYKLSKEGASLP